MNPILRRLEGDRAIWASTLLLLFIGILAIYSASSTLALRLQGGNTEYYLFRHLLLLFASLGVMYVVHKFDYRIFGKYSRPLLILALLLNAFTLFQGDEAAINSANRWISVFGTSFQPSDLAKFALVVFLAVALTQRQGEIKSFKKGFVPLIGTVCLACGFIAPANLSTAVLMFATSLLMLFIAGVRVRYLLGTMAVGLVGLVMLFSFASRASTWNSRIEDYTARLTQAEYVPNYQTVQSYVAIARGGTLGQGPGKSVQRNYLPQAYSDYIYSIIYEEYGLPGGLLVLGLYFFILVRVIAIVTVSKTYGALLAAGLAFLLVLQAFINMGVAVGLLPVTGLQLPFVSLGGTSLLFTGLAFGVILSVSREVTGEAKRRPDRPTAAPIPTSA